MRPTAHIGQQLREARARRLLTQEELAEMAGISAATVVNIERDHQRPHFRTMRKLAEALDVEPTELLPKE